MTISGNTAQSGGGMMLGASNPTLTHVTITDNTAGGAMYSGTGGGMFLSISNPALFRVAITDNTADAGGGMFVYGSVPTLFHVTITNNTAEDFGGAMYLYRADITVPPIIVNSIIWDNYTISENTPSIFVHDYTFSDFQDTAYLYSFMWNLHYNDINWALDGSVDFYIENFNDMYDFPCYGDDIWWCWTTFNENSNIELNPMFTDPENGDYTLQENSPCIDATADSILGESEYYGSAPDIGAFESGGLDCAGVPNGEAMVDCAGVCDGGAMVDCAGECGGDGVEDECGLCDGDGSNCTITDIDLNSDLYDDLNCNKYYITPDTDISVSQNEIQAMQISWETNGIICDGQCYSMELNLELSDADGNIFWNSYNECYPSNDSGSMIIYPDLLSSSNLSPNLYMHVIDVTTASAKIDWVSVLVSLAGDTNFDGIVDILDIVRIVNQIMGNSDFNDDEFTAADFNQDGIVDVLDIVQVVNYILEN